MEDTRPSPQLELQQHDSFIEKYFSKCGLKIWLLHRSLSESVLWKWQTSALELCTSPSTHLLVGATSNSAWSPGVCRSTWTAGAGCTACMGWSCPRTTENSATAPCLCWQEHLEQKTTSWFSTSSSFAHPRQQPARQLLEPWTMHGLNPVNSASRLHANYVAQQLLNWSAARDTIRRVVSRKSPNAFRLFMGKMEFLKCHGQWGYDTCNLVT